MFASLQSCHVKKAAQIGLRCSHGLRFHLRPNSISIFCAALLLVTTSSGHADDSIIRLMSCTADIMLPIHMQTWRFNAARGDDQFAANQITETVARLSRCDDENLAAAVHSAGDNKDLVTAVKDYYLKDKALIPVIGTPVERNARREQQEAATRITMELTLAGAK